MSSLRTRGLSAPSHFLKKVVCTHVHVTLGHQPTSQNLANLYNSITKVLSGCITCRLAPRFASPTSLDSLDALLRSLSRGATILAVVE